MGEAKRRRDSGHVQVISLTRREAAMEFLAEMVTMADGDLIETASIFDVQNGWRCAIQIKDKAMIQNTSGTRRLAQMFLESPARMKNIRALGDDLIALADECDSKNAAGIVPPDREPGNRE